MELRVLPWHGWFPSPFFARLISYALLWILAVEIPLRARGWANAWARRASGQASRIAGAAGAMCATAVLVYFWARAHPWLIRPVLKWTMQQLFSFEASAPTWNEWPILVTAATVIAGVAAIWPRSADAESEPTDSLEPPPEPSMTRVLIRQAVAALVLVGLLAGILQGMLDVMILTSGLIIAGPVLTVMLPRVKAPAMVANIPMAFRWVGALVISLTVAWAVLKLAGNAIYKSDFVLVVTLAIVAPVFRFLLEVGVGRPARAPAPVSPSGPAPSTIILVVLAGTLAGFVLFPSVVWAHDCPEELEACLRMSLGGPLGLIGAALLMAGAAMAERRRREQEQRDRDDRYEAFRKALGPPPPPSLRHPGGKK
jgi:hypothetical protein